MGKERKESVAPEAEEGGDDGKEISWEELVNRIGPFANPLASRKLTKRIYKVIKKAQKQKKLRKGVKEVQKFIRKGERGLVIFAGDTNPFEVISHMPVVCEEEEIPYCYTPSKENLGAACGSRRPTCVVMIKSDADYKDLYTELSGELKALPPPV